MSFRSDSKNPLILISWAILLASFRLRFASLSTAPLGFDIDEALILQWGRKSFLDGQFRLYAPEWTRWEMLPSYLYALGVGIVGLPWARALPALLGLTEVILFGIWAARLWRSRSAGWTAAALLAACPWHFYYSRILGTCVGVAAFVLLSELIPVKRRVARAVCLAAGFLYYTAFRIPLLLEAARAAITRSRPRRAAIGLAAVLVALLAAISTSRFTEVVSRGAYNFTRPELDLLKNWLGSLAMPFVPLAESFRQTTGHFMADYVHVALARSLGSQPPLSWGVSLLVAVGLGCAGYRFARGRERPPVASALALAGSTIFFIGWLGPSLSRFLFLVPAFVAVAVSGLQEIHRRFGRTAQTAAFAAVTIFALLADTHVLTGLRNRVQTEAVFQGRFTEIDAWVRTEIPPELGAERVFLFTDHGFFTAKFFSELSLGYTVHLPIEPEAALQVVRRTSGAPGVRWVLFDEVPKDAETLSGFDKRDRANRIRKALVASGAVKEVIQINAGGRQVAEAFKVIWE